jgi:hypothetical protein
MLQPPPSSASGLWVGLLVAPADEEAPPLPVGEPALPALGSTGSLLAPALGFTGSLLAPAVGCTGSLAAPPALGSAGLGRHMAQS